MIPWPTEMGDHEGTEQYLSPKHKHIQLVYLTIMTRKKLEKKFKKKNKKRKKLKIISKLYAFFP